MKPHHAATLALLGWYLMVPAPGLETRPLSYWSHLQSYDTAKECEQGMRDWREKNDRHRFIVGERYTAEQIKSAWNLAECIEADDPRLKEK